MSASLLSVSSKPGVSISVTCRPSSSKGNASCTTLVHERKPLPILKFEPLTRVRNYRYFSVYYDYKVNVSVLHCCFAASSGTHYSAFRLSASKPQQSISPTYAIATSVSEFPEPGNYDRFDISVQEDLNCIDITVLLSVRWLPC
jgi:hypothetical protein